MKTFFLTLILLSYVCVSAFPTPKCTIVQEDVPKHTNDVIQTVVGVDSVPLFRIERYVYWFQPLLHPLFPFPNEYSVSGSIFLNENMHILSFSLPRVLGDNSTTIDATLGTWISQATPPALNRVHTPSGHAGLQSHSLIYTNSGVCWNPFYANPTNFSSLTNRWVGFRHQREDGSHHGWIELSKTNINHWDYFIVSSWNEHPEPNAGIQVGFPPVPSLKSEITEAGLTLRAGFLAQGMVLEESWVLGESAVWRVLSFPEGVSAPIPIAAKQRYYRLRIAR